jgi:hypothetical protein
MIDQQHTRQRAAKDDGHRRRRFSEPNSHGLFSPTIVSPPENSSKTISEQIRDDSLKNVPSKDMPTVSTKSSHALEKTWGIGQIFSVEKSAS